ncbi:pollen receptor-like kinase 5 [Brachypodium distachyon]|uniref:pollen receptor-like kinase 5 n=1 Tax=Brachypodium distachyon TaxID=15368 RepID=UPI00053000F4|nr:pollen receptor-like kinase 5 [Brachypodium distachyon]|eukprot:XP_010233524.1 pollen receptor-like kinase 5 [Brachypodium distachyon]
MGMGLNSVFSWIRTCTFCAASDEAGGVRARCEAGGGRARGEAGGRQARGEAGEGEHSGAGVLLAVVGDATGVLGRRRRRRQRAAAWSAGSEGDQTPSHPKLQTAPCVNISQAASTSAAAAPAAAPAAAKRGARRDEHGRLVFIQESRVRFEIEDLLRASAEVLGSSNFGSSYKATLLDGRSEVVVKRLKDMNGVGREDFSEHMRRLGRLAHANLVPLVAYLCKKEEKLLITDYKSFYVT